MSIHKSTDYKLSAIQYYHNNTLVLLWYLFRLVLVLIKDVF